MELAVVTISAGLLAGWVGQRSRFCTVGGLRDFLLVRDTTLLLGVVALFAVAWVAFPIVEGLTLATSPAVTEQAEGLGALDPLALEPEAGTGEEALPSLSLAAVILVGGIGVGLVSTFVGGCPFRAHVLAGEGSRQARVDLLGFYIAALAFGFWSPLLLRVIIG